MKKIFIIISLICCGIQAYSASENYTVIVSLDAFRWDYPKMYSTPNLDEIAHDGVKSVMRPSYPASTFPNHYTIATGLVPNHNGIINNTFWDTKTKRQYSMGNPIMRNNPIYYLGEPIWITAQCQGVKTGNIYWVGSDIAIKGEYPTYYKVWSKEPKLNFGERKDEVIRLLTLPEKERPHLIMAYFEEPDGVGHHFGPKSKEVGNMVFSLDSIMGVLRKEIKALPYGDKVNLIVTSDHGMTEISDERFLSITDYVKPEWCENIDGSSPTSFFTKPEFRDSVYNALKGVKHLNVWRKEDIPAKLMYGSSERIGDIVAAPELGWQFSDKPRHLKGAHGYFPQSSDMKVIFFACGPDFKKRYKSKEFVNIDIYPLLAHLLGIKPQVVDGDFERVKPLLK